MATGGLVTPAVQTDTDRTSPAFWLAWTSTLLFFGGFYALLVPLPRYLAQIGLPDWQIGMILGAFGGASVVGRPFAGVSVDRFGPRPVLLLGAAGLIVGAASVPFTASPLLQGVLRVAQAAGYVAFTTAGTALVIQLTPEAHRGRQMALFGAAANVAITMSPAVTTALLAVVPLEGGFYAAAGLALVAGVLAMSVTPPPRTEQAAVNQPTLSSAVGILWPSMLTAGLFGAGFVAFFLFAPILSERRGMSAGLPYVVYGISIVATRLVSGRWLDRIGTRTVLLVAAALTVAGLLAAAFATTPIALGVAAFLAAAGGGLFHPALIVHHARMLPGAPGRSSAAFYLGFDLGLGLGGWLFGLVLDLAGLVWLYVVAAGIILLTVPMTFAIVRPPAAPPMPGSARLDRSEAR